MRLDPVHDVQSVFRKILSAMSSPGTIADLSREAGLLDLDISLNKGILLVALALLDAETTFALLSAIPGNEGKALSQMTYAKEAALDEADFVFVVETAAAVDAIRSAKRGSLVDPHLGATLVVEVLSLADGGALLLSGPGIKTTARLGVEPGPGWLAARAAKNIEFPLGVDLILVDELSRLVALPRTTAIREEG
jgi:alpha-D-ribose 1-methylphosphonate 5-triphosphate synthase subunit PhnH